MKHILTDLKREMDNNTIIVRQFKLHCQQWVDAKEKIYRETMNLI